MRLTKRHLSKADIGHSPFREHSGLYPEIRRFAYEGPVLAIFLKSAVVGG